MSEQETTPETPHDTPNTESRGPVGGFIHHQRRAAEEAIRAVDSLIPDGFKSHTREAAKEWLTSFRVLAEGAAASIDAELTRMRKAASQSAPNPDSPSGGESSTGKTKVKIEVG